MADLSFVVAEAVRANRGRVLGRLLRLCENLDDAEEAFQDAVVAAVVAWEKGVPANPGAWLMTAAKNKALDARRRRKVADENFGEIAAAGEYAQQREGVDELSRDYLKLIFSCCHPELSIDSQIALTLKLVAGFSMAEIARAFVCSEATVSQRILRAKQTIARSMADPLEGADGPRWPVSPAQVAAVLAVLYAMFNEGHIAHSGPLMNVPLQAEALRMTRELSDLVPTEPEVFGALAIMAFSAARAATRVDAEGLPIFIADQDRTQWSVDLLREGLMALSRATTLGGVGTYVLQARIAAEHMIAPSVEGTNWAAIIALYAQLVERTPSPVLLLNQAIAVSMRDGPETGLALLMELEEPLRDYHWFFTARAELRRRCAQDPAPDLQRALQLVSNDAERRLIERRLRT